MIREKKQLQQNAGEPYTSFVVKLRQLLLLSRFHISDRFVALLLLPLLALSFDLCCGLVV